ncbi:hypothetical protein MKX03_008809 [Papaver bracteatum]|nr:hypothetical protein MKX03_008809 [Papaver bracteatum]
MAGLSSLMMNLIRGGVAQNRQSDGRKRLTYRPISVETGVLDQSLGSARVRIGGTEVYASVGAERSTIDRLRPNQGRVYIDVKCSPVEEKLRFRLVTCFFFGRGGEELAKELSSYAIDLSSLIIVEGQHCLDLYLDGLNISADGNLLDALGAAMKAALRNTVLPKVTAENVADTVALPVIVTLTKVGVYNIADATSEEESLMCPAVSICIILGVDVLRDMCSVSNDVGKALMSQLDLRIAEAEVSDAAVENFWYHIHQIFGRG